ncbi:MAG: hypothetical protein K9N62_18875 [Verrucomicrobia bacterium]|nr:hypothetical protein [Verrucomicrobiota bacterium]
MIQLHHDYLLIQTSTGETIPCSAELVANELIGNAASQIDPALVRQAAAAVVHYFKHDLARTAVSIADFSLALERVLRTLGLDVRTSDPQQEEGVSVSDLRDLITESEVALELAFFPELRNELQNQLTHSPDLLRFEGLRGCVKHLLGARRWSGRCQNLNDQIVEFIRQCLRRDGKTDTCGLVIR